MLTIAVVDPIPIAKTNRTIAGEGGRLDEHSDGVHRVVHRICIESELASDPGEKRRRVGRAANQSHDFLPVDTGYVELSIYRVICASAQNY